MSPDNKIISVINSVREKGASVKRILAPVDIDLITTISVAAIRSGAVKGDPADEVILSERRPSGEDENPCLQKRDDS